MRYAESEAKKAVEFQRRNRIPSAIQFLIIFVIAYFSLIGYFALSTSTAGFTLWSFILVALLSGFMTYVINYNRDLVLATEFQNAIFANALGSSYIFTIITRKDGTIVFVDRGLQTYFPQYSRMRHSHLEHIATLADITPQHKRAIESSIASMQKESLLLSIKSGENERQDVVLSIDPIVTPGNFTVLRARPYSSKRSDNKTGETTNAALQKSIESLMHQMPLALFYADDSGKLLFVSNQLANQLGYTEGYFNGGNYYLEQLLVNPSAAFPSKHFEGEVLFRHATGQQVAFYTSTQIEEHNDVLRAMSGVIYPSQAEPAKKNSSIKAAASYPAEPVASSDGSHFTDLFEEAPIAIVRCNNHGQIIQVNKAFDRLIKLDGAARPKHLMDMIANNKKEEVSLGITRLFEPSTDIQHVDVELLLPNNETINVSIFANKSEQNNILTFYVIDVTDQKNLEMRFAHSQKMQAVGQLAGGVAHDFNNLLTAMIGFCDLLLMRHPAGDQSFADIMQIKQNANRAANLVRQLLAFSRRQTLQAKNLDITEVLAELSNLIRRLIGENIELKVIHGRDLHMMKADQGQLEQVIINLAVNARDAMKDGGTLTIRSSNITIDSMHMLPRQMLAPAGEDAQIPPGGYVLIEVSDTGTGIAKEVLPKIFEPFFSTKEIGSGTGLGLATVYGIIKQTGGYIFVNSVVGKGTQFHIYFPALSAEEERAVEVEIQEQNAQDLTGRETILLVEDETPVRAFASRALKNKGYTVIEADCAEAALSWVREHGSKLDLIVTDVIMPGMNGPTMVDHISADFPDIKVVFMSGYAEDIFMHNYGSERSFNFLAKPFTLKQLAAKVKEVLSS